ncbi:MAG: Ig-like domain-containing protein [Bryobacteraceae bacterium]
MRWMLLAKLRFTLLLVALAGLAHGRYVVSITQTGSAPPSLTVVDENLNPIGSLAAPSGARQVLLSDDGSKLIVIAENAQAPVSFVPVSAGGLGQLRTTALSSGTPVVARLSADGSLLYVATRNPGLIHAVQVGSEQPSGAPIPIPGDPIDMELTPDGQYLIVLSSPNFLTAIQTSNWQVQQTQAIAGNFSDPRLSLSVAPFGSIFITGQNTLIEFRGLPPFDELARTSLAGGNFTHPGKLQFIPPAGTRAFAPNLVQTGHSVGVFDFSLRGPGSPAGTFVAGAAVASTVGNPFSTTPELVNPLIVTRDLTGVALAPAIGQIFNLNYVVGGGVTVNDLRIGQQPVTGIVSLTASNEFPNRLYLFYVNDSGVLSRFPLSGLGNILTRQQAAGNLTWVAMPSNGTPGSLYGFGGGRLNVPAGSTVRYYVRLVDTANRPVKGRTINFRPITSGLQLLQTSSVTSREGWAFVDVVAPASGEFTVEASLGNLTPVTFTSTVAAQSGGGGSGGGGSQSGPKLVKVSGDGQLSAVGGGNKPLIVRIVDADGKPIKDKQVVWQTTSPNVQFTSPPQTVTNENGLAQVNLFYLGTIPLGEAFVLATVDAVSDVGTVTFYLVQYPNDQFGVPIVQLETPPPSDKTIRVKLGAPQAGAIRYRILSGGGPGRPLGVPIPKVGLKVSTENQDPTQGPVASCEGGSALSDENGVASCTLVALGKPGATLLTVTVGEGFIFFPGFTLIVDPGDPVPPVIVSGNNQSGKTGATLPQRLVARIVDAGGNPLPGAQVVWTVSNPSALTLIDVVNTTNANGEVSTRVQLGNIPGTFTVTVRAGDQQASFTVNVQSTATTFRKVSGDGQPAVPVNTAFPQPLVVEVLDAQNNPVTNVPVSWSVSGPATLSAASTPTGTNGRAQVTVTAGATAGTITVTASVAGLNPVTFSLQSRPPGPAITAQSFSNYSTGAAGRVAPGTLMLVTGGGIAKNVNELAVASLFTGRLPLSFRGLVVEFRQAGQSYYAPIFWIARDGASETALIQVPYEITGPTVDVIVSIDGVQTTVGAVPVDPVSPGIIEDQIDNRRAAIVIRSDGVLVTKSTPARRGETVRLYAIGLGQTTPRAETNRPGRAEQAVDRPVIVGINNAGVDVVGARLAENLFGIYEVIFRIPEDASLGDAVLAIAVSGPDGRVYYSQPQGTKIPIGPAQ